MKKYFLFLIVALTAAVSFTSCSDDDEIKKHYSDMTLEAGETKLIGESGWNTSNKYIVTADGSNITAQRVGTATVYNSDYRFNVTVTPKYNLYEEPVLTWGRSKDLIGNYMINHGYSELSDTNEMLIYKGEDYEDYIFYGFDDYGELKISGVLIDAAYAETLGAFLGERYVPLMYEDAQIILMSLDSRSLIYVTTEFLGNNAYILVGYSENTTNETLDDIFGESNDLSGKTRCIDNAKNIINAKLVNTIKNVMK